MPRAGETRPPLRCRPAAPPRARRARCVSCRTIRWWVVWAMWQHVARAVAAGGGCDVGPRHRLRDWILVLARVRARRALDPGSRCVMMRRLTPGMASTARECRTAAERTMRGQRWRTACSMARTACCRPYRRVAPAAFRTHVRRSGRLASEDAVRGFSSLERSQSPTATTGLSPSRQSPVRRCDGCCPHDTHALRLARGRTPDPAGIEPRASCGSVLCSMLTL